MIQSAKITAYGGMTEMLDFMFIALTLIFFALSFWYVRACDRL
jgi:hypothetical protein